MKVGEKVHHADGGDTLIVQEFHDFTPYIEQNKALRDMGKGHTGENRHIGRVPLKLIAEWLKEAGVKWDDHEAVQTVMKRKLLSGEFDKLRNWEGTY